MKIIARDRKGVEHVLEGNDGWTVMEALRDAGLPITAECGGACACATCHVYVEDGWEQKTQAAFSGRDRHARYGDCGRAEFASVVPDPDQCVDRRHQGDDRTGII